MEEIPANISDLIDFKEEANLPYLQINQKTKHVNFDEQTNKNSETKKLEQISDSSKTKSKSYMARVHNCPMFLQTGHSM